VKHTVAVHWFRRDLRLEDNHALCKALASGLPVLAVFIFDTDILDHLPRRDARVQFIHNEISRLHNELKIRGSSLRVYCGKPSNTWGNILDEFEVKSIYVNRDYEPYAQQRDREVHSLLEAAGIPMLGYKDHVIFEKNEVVKEDGSPYLVFTPYSHKWKQKFVAGESCTPHVSQGNFLQEVFELPRMEEIGFEKVEIDFPSREIPLGIINNYEQLRDIPSVNGTSRLSIHLRFGTVSIRSLVQIAQARNEKWLNELIWRDFYQMILYHFPHSADHAIKPIYDRVEWINDPMHFDAWCNGKTGYPLVDAGMRELNETGFMHNRVRMVTASFLVKHLLIDWRFGERYFASKLFDFDLASNVGGWQWAAGCGCDAAPYFRVFNPTTQQQKHDPEFKYCRKWIPELDTPAYPLPIVDHAKARLRALKAYKAIFDIT
jgi:deoxyribodipyrimidine photo-lyase